MASRYNWGAEREEDVVITETPRQRDPRWMQQCGPMSANMAFDMIPNKTPLRPPRLIWLMLESDNREYVDGATMTWRLNLQGMLPVAPGSILMVAHMTITNQPAGTYLEYALSGFQTETYSTNSSQPYNLRWSVVSRSGTNNYLETSAGPPVAVTLKDTTLHNLRVSIHRLTAGNGWDGNTTIRLALQIKEPGANIY